MRRAAIRLASLLMVLPGAAAAGPAAADCATLLPPDSLPASRRALVPQDLVRLRDIGPPDPQGYADPLFTLSPDRRLVAFQLRQADPVRNGYCLAMMVLPVSGKGRPKIVDSGGEALLLGFDFRGIADFPMGYLRVVSPRWSADGHWFAFLKRAGGRTQVWRAFADGRASEAVTRAPIDVVDFRIAPDGASIVYATRPDVEQHKQDYEREAPAGWRYDDRFVPALSKRPLAPASAARAIRVIDGGTGLDREPSPGEAALVAGASGIMAAGGPGAAEAGLRILAINISGGAKRGSFSARRPDGAWTTCAAAACEGAVRPWWDVPNARVRFFRPEGWARASTAIHEWDLRTGGVRRLYVTDDLLSSCAPLERRLLCRIDSSLEPARLAWLDPVTGRRESLFDPNPEFARLALGRAERLHWRNRFGSETIADLVLPVDYRKGRRYPLVVVQYETRGFLRGGTADEYPIQAFANRGYAVLSFKRPFLASLYAARDPGQAGRQNLAGFADRRNVHASLEQGVRMVISRGIADPARIGITGLSDGASTVDWALIHSTLFSAAATSSCCWDSSGLWQVGPSAARHFRDEGYPGAFGRGDPFWKQISLAENAGRLSVPILVNAAEAELLDALFTFTALREAAVPIDLFVYPGEYHARWQPAHRLATYERSLDWFDYWLRCVRSADPRRAAELRAWDGLRDEALRRHPATTGPAPPACPSSPSNESMLRH